MSMSNKQFANLVGAFSRVCESECTKECEHCKVFTGYTGAAGTRPCRCLMEMSPTKFEALVYRWCAEHPVSCEPKLEPQVEPQVETKTRPVPSVELQHMLEAHRAMWTYLAEHPHRTKAYYFLEELGMVESARPMDECYACEYAERHLQSKGADICTECPLDWEAANTLTCKRSGSLYSMWRFADTLHEKSMYARVIAKVGLRL